MNEQPDVQTVVLTLVALVAFASNSLLTRLALGAHEIDAATFTAIRLVAGAVVLALLVRVNTGRQAQTQSRSVYGPLALFVYAAPFSFAYLRIGAAVGALVLFGSVQLTMMAYALYLGERPAALAWAGLALATGGLVALAAPSVTRPDPIGLVLMIVAGMAWAVYTLVGRTTVDPLAANARSFLWSCPLALALVAASMMIFPSSGGANRRGIVLALISGGITSGLGYAIWYRALTRLSVTQAVVAQLGTPVLSALGAVALLGERLSARLVVSGASVLCGIGLVLLTRTRSRRHSV